MPKSRGDIEEKYVSFNGETMQPAYTTYKRGSIQFIPVEEVPDSGPQLPGESYLSGSNWLYSDDAGIGTTPAGKFVSFTGTPSNAAPGDSTGVHGKTTGCIALGGHLDGNYLASGYKYIAGTYTVTFGLVTGPAFGYGLFSHGADTVDLQYSTDNVSWTQLNTGGNRFTKSSTGILGPYNIAGANIVGTGLSSSAIQHYKLSFTLAASSYLRWKVNPNAVLDGSGDTNMVGLCETIIQLGDSNKGYTPIGHNYGNIQITGKWTSTNALEIHTSAPFYGKVYFSVSSI